jgi:nitrate/nitrite transport system permease protein
MQPLDVRAAILSALLALAFLGIWQALTAHDKSDTADGEYARLVAGAGETARVPSPIEVFSLAIEMFEEPFYDRGPNDKGIGLQLAYSIGRVLLGYVLALLVAIPAGFLIGMSPLMMQAINPFVQVLRPVSPLAWMPLALFIIRDSVQSSVFVIFICSIWPVLINTAFGVSAVRKDYLSVARTLELSRFETALHVILPAATPTILTGMRISIGISWLVIVAAEMLVGGTGIGYFVWNEWNNLDLAAVIVSILLIGVVGMFLDFVLGRAARALSFEEA